MKRLKNHHIGVDQGSVIMFSDFEDDGPMWAGEGPRRRGKPIRFTEAYRHAPVVHVSITMWDADGNTNQRGDVSAAGITAEGFELVFRTWGDSRVARVRVDWMSIGELRHADEWDLY